MMRHLIASGERRPISVLYSARTIDEFAYKPELQRLARRQLIALTLTVTGDVREDAGDRGEANAAASARHGWRRRCPRPIRCASSAARPRWWKTSRRCCCNSA